MIKKLIAFLILVLSPMLSMAIESVDILADDDAALYAQIFMLQDKEKIDAAKKLENKLTDKFLMN